MKKYNTLLLLVLFSLTVYAQSPNIQWIKSLGGTGDDACYSIKQSIDGGYIVFGSSNSNSGQVTGNHGDRDYWLAKLDNNGLIQWQKSYGGSDIDQAQNINLTQDGGYILVGYSRSNTGDLNSNYGFSDIWVVKINNVGDIQWQKNYGGTLSDQGKDIKQTTDGGYIVLGTSYSNNGDLTSNNGLLDYWLLKLNSLGVIEWQKNYGGSNNDFSSAVEQTLDGGYIISGYTSSNDLNVSGNHGGYVDGWVVKTNATGVIEWQKAYGGSNDDRINIVKKTTDGGYILGGRTNSTDGDVTSIHGTNSDSWVVKINSLGLIEWQKTYGGTNLEEVFCIEQTNDNGYIFTGITGSSNGDVTVNLGNYDGWLAKLSNNGTLEWQKSLGNSSVDIAFSVQQTSDGWYVVSGTTSGGFTDYHGGSQDYFVCKLGTNLTNPTFELETIVLYPNPVINNLNIKTSVLLDKKVVIYDVFGKATESFIENNSVNISNLQSGIYFIEFQDENKNTLCKKFIKK